MHELFVDVWGKKIRVSLDTLMNSKNRVYDDRREVDIVNLVQWRVLSMYLNKQYTMCHNISIFSLYLNII